MRMDLKPSKDWSEDFEADDKKTRRSMIRGMVLKDIVSVMSGILWVLKALYNTLAENAAMVENFFPRES
jgi:hypothetical protein